MADKKSESLREFADIIQQKAGPVPTEQHAPEPPSTPKSDPARAHNTEGLQSVLKRQPRAIVAGIAAGAGVAVGYLLAKIRRR